MRFELFGNDEETAPILPILLETPEGRSLECLALVDSGTSETVIPAELLPHDIEWDELPEVGGITGSYMGGFATYRRLECSAYFGGVRFTDSVRVSPPHDTPFLLVLLGREDFFATFTVTFELHKTPPVYHVKPPRGETLTVDFSRVGELAKAPPTPRAIDAHVRTVAALGASQA